MQRVILYDNDERWRKMSEKKREESSIEQVQRYETEILDEIHRVCRKNHLRYSLAYGTLIGAVRHQGFIPWDDDIDLMMPRKDYEKLLRIWKKEADPRYIIQSYRTDYDYTNNFAKVRKDHTTFIQDEGELQKRYHRGIFVDIFPADRLAPGAISEKIQYCACAVNLLFSRGYTSGDEGWRGKAEKAMLRIPRYLQIALRDWSEKIMVRWNRRSKKKYFCACTIQNCSIYYPADMFDTLKRIPFGGRKYYSVVDTDAFLRPDYGDYMQLPPVEERVWKHHPLIIDFEKNYEELNYPENQDK